MAIAFKAVGSGSTTVPTMPAHVAGDLLIGFAFRDGSNTGPAIPAGWTQVYRAGASTCSISVAYKWAASSAEVSGTWTSASSLVIASYSGVDTVTPVGGYIQGGATSTIVSYNALAGTDPTNQSWFLCFAGHRSVNTAIETPPTGTILRTSVVDTTDEAALFDTDGALSAWPLHSVSVGGTSSGWHSIVVELREQKPVQLSSGGEATIGVSLLSNIYTAPLPVSTYSYARVGVYDPDYCSDVVAVDPSLVSMADDSEVRYESDRGLFTFSGTAEETIESDTAIFPATLPLSMANLSHTAIILEHRQSAHKHLDGFANTQYVSRMRQGVSGAVSSIKGTTAGVARKVTLPSAGFVGTVAPATGAEIVYKASRVGASIPATHDLRLTTSELYASIHARHTVGNVPPYVYWSLDQDYDLYSNAAQAYEWVLDQEYALIFPMPEFSLDSEWSLFALEEREWSLDSEWSNGISEWQVDAMYAIAGCDILYEFQTHLNALRANNNLPPFDICTREVLDIAQLHSENQAKLRIQYHDSVLLPPGYRTIEERVSLMYPGAEAAENIASVLTLTDSVDTVTGYELFDVWLNSPIHLANMLSDFGPDAELEFLLGIDFYVPYVTSDSGTFGPYEGYVINISTLVLINFNIAGSAVPVEFTLNSQYSLETPVRENIDMEWGTYTYTPVRKRFYSPYSLRVAASHSTPYGAYVTVAHTARMQYSVQVAMVSPYGSTVFVDIAHTATYDVEQYAKVVADHSGSWAMAHTFTHTLSYADASVVRTGHVSTYGDKPSVVSSHTASYDETVMVRAYSRYPYSDSETVRKQHISPYALVGYVVKGHTAKYADQVPVTTAHTVPFDMLDYDPVTTQHRAPYSMLSGSVVTVGTGYSVFISGFEIDCNSLRLDMDEGDAFWSGTINITSPEVFAGIKRNDPVTVYFFGEVFNLRVDSKTIRRDSPVDIDLVVSALSPVSSLDEPDAEPIDRTQVTAIMARDLVQDLLGQVVDWQIHNWLILPYRFAITQRSPLAAARMVIEAVGGVLRSNPDGSLVAAYRFPVTIPDYATTAPDVSVSDVEDNLSYNGRAQNMEVFNEFRIRDSQDYQSDYFEWKLDTGSDDSGILRAYVIPWRPATVETQHTSPGAVNMIYLGIESRTETQEVEIVNGAAQLSWPAVNILSVDWLSDPLGVIYLESRTKEIKVPDTTTNWGYGLARITYTVECLKYSVQSPIGSSVQFILVDKGM